MEVPRLSAYSCDGIHYGTIPFGLKDSFPHCWDYYPRIGFNYLHFWGSILGWTKLVTKVTSPFFQQPVSSNDWCMQGYKHSTCLTKSGQQWRACLVFELFVGVAKVCVDCFIAQLLPLPALCFLFFSKRSWFWEQSPINFLMLVYVLEPAFWET